MFWLIVPDIADDDILAVVSMVHGNSCGIIQEIMNILEIYNINSYVSTNHSRHVIYFSSIVPFVQSFYLFSVFLFTVFIKRLSFSISLV